MKINVEIDCTPEEARRFLGLPDLAPMQQAVMEKLQQQMLDATAALAPEALLRQWAPMLPQTADGLRAAMAAMMGGLAPKAPAPPGGERGGRAPKE